jgi:hypothetical protein
MKVSSKDICPLDNIHQRLHFQRKYPADFTSVEKNPSNTSPTRKANTINRSIVCEPTASLSGPLIYQCTWQAISFFEYLLHNLLLASSGRNESNLHTMGNDW